MEEIWRPVKGYEGLYEVSNEGRVKSLDRVVLRNGILYKLRGTILKQYKRQNYEYQFVRLSKEGHIKTVSVHFLIVQAFPEVCGELFKGCQINHKDENPANNKAENLEVCTAKYNANYGTRNKKIGKANGIPVNQYTIDKQFVRLWQSATEAQRELGINHSCITHCCKGHPKHSTAGGFRWEYAK